MGGFEVWQTLGSGACPLFSGRLAQLSENDKPVLICSILPSVAEPEKEGLVEGLAAAR